MRPILCSYCGAACDNTVPLDWVIEAVGETPATRIHLNLCERCSRSWATAHGEGFVPSMQAEAPKDKSRPRRRKSG
jgi:hypothetical protein